jgi:5-hydroxyisourate hydrolase-like protein (transthyretin family)
MMSNGMKRAGTVIVAALLALSLGGMAQAQTMSTGSVTPAVGLAGSRLAFVATGFQGSSQDADEQNSRGEQAAYWINAPDGSVISVETLTQRDGEGHATRPLIATANTDGRVSLSWTAPKSLAPGAYSLVIHGLASQHEARIGFTIAPGGSQTVMQTTVAPSAAPAGSSLRFAATGFGEEKVAYWINTPSGEVISTQTRTKKENEQKASTQPLQDLANDDGEVTLFWTAPTGLAPGAYSLVIHGLDSQHEVRLFFTIT